MSMINALLDEIDDLTNKKVAEKTKNKSRIRELEEDKKRAGFRGDRHSVIKITRQIENLKNENYELFDFEIRNCEKKIDEIIVDYYENNFTISDIFFEENIPKNIQEKWLEKSNFGEDTGYLYVDEIKECDIEEYYYFGKYYFWRYYNPFLEIELESETLKSLKNKVESQGQKFIGFNDELIKKSEYQDRQTYHVINDKLIDELDWYRNRYSNDGKIKILSTLSDNDTRVEILDQLSDSEFPLTKEQIIRLCEKSESFYIYDCNMCFTFLDRILRKHEDIIDEDLLNEVNEKSSRTFYYDKSKHMCRWI